MPTWDPRDYERNSATQESWARECLARLHLGGRERTLDIGCGDGRISAELARRLPQGSVLGIDASPEMIAHARSEHLEGTSNLAFAVADAARLALAAQFDLVVSFNCLHWVHDQAAMLRGIARSLVPGGRFFLHLAGHGNVAGIRTVVETLTEREPWAASFADFAFPWCFPEPDGFRRLAEQAGLHLERIELLERPMTHTDAGALAGWVRTTWLPYLERLPDQSRAAFIDEVVADYLKTRPPVEGEAILVDAVRLEAEGSRP